MMIDKMNEQLEASMAPLKELTALNVATLQQLAEKQSALFSTLVSNGVTFAETAGQQKDVVSLAEAQKAYLEALQATVTDSAKEAYTVVSEAQQKAGSLLKTVSEEAASKFTVGK